MISHIGLPNFRIEVREKNVAPDAPWKIAALAYTEIQANRQRDSLAGGTVIEVRIVPNDPGLVVEVVRAPTAVEIADYLARQAATAVPAATPEPAIAAATEAPAPTAAEIGATNDALAGATQKLPFDSGDEVIDIHTGVTVRVTKIHPIDGSGKAFDWQNEKAEAGSRDKTGTCPFAAVGCFELVAPIGGQATDDSVSPQRPLADVLPSGREPVQPENDDSAKKN